MWQLLPPTALLLVVSAGWQSDPPKAVVSLDPPWYRVLERDSVTLKCQGTSILEDNSVQWWHNGSLISSQSSSYLIGMARAKDSGVYRCKTHLTKPSDLVRLEVHVGWVLLQAVQQVFQEGEKIQLQCHSWKDKPLHKVSYFRNGRAKQFSHPNRNFYISNATRNDSGSYFCRGLIGKRNESSTSLNIIVQGPAGPSISPSWHQVFFYLLTGLLFAVDTGLYFFMQRNLRSLMEDWRNHKVKRNQDSQGK
ncbi:low affinity immunoglobulin gamma Fc region receptor III-A-like isoform X1 [Loxodonta africana]|uniref:low affinity immunoglobulin gamma Fc region receptor III-A-like n=1 Tax=Elephas maximus indicus TaxID=99487 RepID=UPI0005403850|nr:low affinity immunoglobulin gamma Fc region receptor III-A-like [Loxodonta africana]XP_049737029.1 low affinity immunoglobulin gamma Fc region receptor III-A-like [Elephas maximus indicus]